MPGLPPCSPGHALRAMLSGPCSPGHALRAMLSGLSGPCSPGHALRAMLSGPCSPGHALRAMLSGPCSPGHALRAMLSGPCSPGHALRAMLSGPCSPGHALRAMLSGPCSPGHALRGFVLVRDLDGHLGGCSGIGRVGRRHLNRAGLPALEVPSSLRLQPTGSRINRERARVGTTQGVGQYVPGSVRVGGRDHGACVPTRRRVLNDLSALRGPIAVGLVVHGSNNTTGKDSPTAPSTLCPLNLPQLQGAPVCRNCPGNGPICGADEMGASLAAV